MEQKNVKLKRRLIIIGQIMLILITGFTVNKVIKVNSRTIMTKSIVPYISSVEVTNYRSMPNEPRERYEVMKSEDVWANQEDKFFDSEDRYNATELAQMIVDGNAYKAERIINIDKYDKKIMEAVESEVDKLKAIKRVAEIETKKIAAETELRERLENEEYDEIIQAFPHTTFKSYMPWTALSPKYAQGQLCAKATKDPATAIMKYEGRYLVALGFAYADHVGQKFDVVMEDGSVIPVMIGDFKATEHTDANQSTTVHDGSIIEFIVSSNNEAAVAVKQTGNFNTIFPGKVKEFRKII